MTQPLLSELHQRGIKLRLVDDRLDVVAPTGALTNELLGRLKSGREELVHLLRQAAAGTDNTPIVSVPQDRYEPFELADIQHAYWAGSSSAVELGGVQCHYYFELDSDGLDPFRLEDSLNELIAHHDMLRAVVLPDGRQLVMAASPRYRIEVTDLRDQSPAAVTEVLDRRRTEMAGQAPAAGRWPLFDVRATRLAGGGLRLHLSFNILIIDYASLSIFFRDWRRCYQQPGALGALPELTYRDYLLTRRAARTGVRYLRAEKYWLERIPGLPPAPDLPVGQLPAGSRIEFSRRAARLPRRPWEAIKVRAARHGVTPSVALLTAFADVLRSWSPRRRSFTLNLTLFERPPLPPGITDLIGDFTSLTMLAVPEPGDQSFAGRAQQLNDQLLSDLEHADYSGVRVLRERARALGGAPGAAMPVVFTSAIGGDSSSVDRDFFGEFEFGSSQTPQVWLDHQVMEEHGELVFNWDAVEEIFPPGLLDDMFASYRESLNRLAAGEIGRDGIDEPDQSAILAWDGAPGPVGLPPAQARERQAANDTIRDFAPVSLGELVERQAAREPEAVAVIAGGATASTLTYGELIRDADRLAHRLRDLGAGRGMLVGVLLERGCAQVTAVLAIVRAGAAYLPIDPAWPAARRRRVLELAGATLVVGPKALAEPPDWPADLTVVDPTEPPEPVEDGEPLPLVSLDDLAYVIFTSGSTGEPKGVMIDHRGAANTIQDLNDRFDVGPADRVLALSSLSFDLSVYDIFGLLAAGGTVVLPDPAGARDPRHWAELIRCHGVTVWNSVPALIRAWLESEAETAAPSPEPGIDSLRLVLLSGDWIPVPLPEAVRQRHRRAEVISLGGATEASIWSVCYPIGVVPPQWSRIPYGRALANQTMQVFDDRLEHCPVWSVGEIYIGGTGVARGYWGDPDLTAARFIVHPGTGERLYRTGDLGRFLPGGDIEFLGREDSQVKINGYRIELGEIDATLRRLPGIADVAVRVADGSSGRRQLVAYVVPERLLAGQLDLLATRALLAELLPEYLVPQHILEIDEVPLSANGKVNPAALPLPWDEAGPEVEVREPADDLERRLLMVWNEALGRADTSVVNNLFELGADSLDAVRILGALRTEFGIELDGDQGLQILFESPTVFELAETLRGWAT